MDSTAISKSPRFQPPLDFLPVGRITWAKFADNPPAFIANARSRARGRKRAGVIYEARVHDYLADKCEGYIPGPWIVFTEDGSSRLRWSCPDALILDISRGHAVIVEVKLRHTDRAWWQIRRQYQPLLKHIWPKWSFSALEIAQHIDPHTPFPERLDWMASPDVPASGFGIHMFSSRR